MNKGFTFIEVIISVAIMALLVGLSMAAFSSFAKREALGAAAGAAAAMLRDARAQTIASVGGMQYGVRVEPDRFILFQGSTYASTSPTNRPFYFSARVKASSTAQSFVFERVTGDASSSGMIQVYLASEPSVKKSVVVQGTGLVSVE
jgi:prepilin-type N-terminal cleavage/methylation domain-containing protein